MADVAEVTAALERGTVSDVTRVLGRRGAKKWRNGDRTALSLALKNRSPADRLAICHLLLDRGADAAFVLKDENAGALHLLFSHGPHDYDGEKELAARLIDAGADVNLVSRRFGSPLALLARTFKFSDATLQPFYDVLIESGKLNLFTVDQGGRTMMENIAVKVAKRASLYQQLIDYAIASGQQEAIPPTGG